MPDFFSISKRVPPFPSRRVLNSEKENASEKERDQEAKCGNKDGKKEKIEGKAPFLFQCAKDFIIPNIYFTSQCLRFRGKGRKARKFSGFV